MPYKGVVDTFAKLYAEGKIPIFFSGIAPRVFWISLGGFVFFGAYEKAKVVLNKYIP